MKIKLPINGLMVEAQYNEQEIIDVHLPLLQRLTDLKNTPSGKRKIIFLSAPPGTGKSTLTAFWEYLSRQNPYLPEIQTLPMDGFHHYNHWLDEHGLRPFKGSPETFNVPKLAKNLELITGQNGTWPQYDRKLHNPVENAIEVTAPVVIVEGNWLLLNDANWRTLQPYCDISIFIQAPAETLRERLIARKCAGGLSIDEANAFYLRTDGPNVLRVLKESRPAYITLSMNADGEYHLV
ncbi:nucleoside/nucleotide kinase family protein [Jinshanibacter sp. LJY008]|uniref:Nucleoside/nucleotide kinase family protein n=1 Tax=Limnobaculum eriocheiris TaxID=2897391 RepID=A0A9X1SL88_9GAMM|nr:nucleoside/nucleotide kinase family protein [Limnobaculum eriocheiris]MCD1126455.1 nucleoside/nucleotide kinase family protein [Limnobaculum eriocheiris]